MAYMRRWARLALMAGVVAAPAAYPTLAHAQPDPKTRVVVTGTLIDSAGAPMAATRFSVCPQGDPGKPLLFRYDPVVLGGADVTTDAAGAFTVEFFQVDETTLLLAKTRVATDTPLRLCVLRSEIPKYRWVGPWLDLKTLASGKAIAFGTVRPE